MLRNCLQSLVRQRLPADISVSIVVVENNETDDCRNIVDELSAQSDVPIVYAQERTIGIPVARNRTLDLALSLDPDWIAFIDDDEFAGPEWLQTFVKASEAYNADVLEGRVQSLRAETGEIIAHNKRRPTGVSHKTVATCNTMMRARIASPQGMGLRFDEGMRFSGGSDKDYFLRAAERGAVIVWVQEAVVFESVPANRLTLRWQLQRERSIGANAVNIMIRHKGLPYAVGRTVPKLVGRLGRHASNFQSGSFFIHSVESGACISWQEPSARSGGRPAQSVRFSSSTRSHTAPSTDTRRRRCLSRQQTY